MPACCFEFYVLSLSLFNHVLLRSEWFHQLPLSKGTLNGLHKQSPSLLIYIIRATENNSPDLNLGSVCDHYFHSISNSLESTVHIKAVCSFIHIEDFFFFNSTRYNYVLDLFPHDIVIFTSTTKLTGFVSSESKKK